MIFYGGFSKLVVIFVYFLRFKNRSISLLNLKIGLNFKNKEILLNIVVSFINIIFLIVVRI